MDAKIDDRAGEALERIIHRDGIKVEFEGFEPDAAERAAYVSYVKAKYGADLNRAKFTLVKGEDGGESVDIEVGLRQPNFDRIRRITGRKAA